MMMMIIMVMDMAKKRCHDWHHHGLCDVNGETLTTRRHQVVETIKVINWFIETCFSLLCYSRSIALFVLK